MTRINLVDPSELMDQHLFAEFREIKMVPKALRRSLNSKSMNEVLRKIPSEFTLNVGHVKFFYDKGEFLRRRFKEICAELDRRGYNYDRTAVLDSDGVFDNLPKEFQKDYIPTKAALEIIRTRIAEKIAMRPGWYKKS